MRWKSSEFISWWGKERSILLRTGLGKWKCWRGHLSCLHKLFTDVTLAPVCSGFPERASLLLSALILDFLTFRSITFSNLQIIHKNLYTYLWKYIKFFIYFLSDTCSNFSSGTCNVPLYWYAGFLSLQSSIDAAVIEVSVITMENNIFCSFQSYL